MIKHKETNLKYNTDNFKYLYIDMFYRAYFKISSLELFEIKKFT